jgi:4-hydroxy-tetrahydrodipicolinate reductase
MKIALIGHGKMGKEVEALARERGITIAGIFTGSNNAGGSGLNAASLRDVDVCIDFSTPAAVFASIEAVARCGKDIVVGTTGWADRLDDARKLSVERGIGLLYASNFSLGMHLFIRIVTEAAQLFDGHPEYDVSVQEVHHRGKADSPSGTALSLAGILLQNVKRKTEIVNGTVHGRIRPEQLHVTSGRVGWVQGDHTVTFDSESDRIELMHSAKNRRGFAHGALLAAEWVKGKKGFFTLNDLITPGDKHR